MTCESEIAARDGSFHVNGKAFAPGGAPVPASGCSPADASDYCRRLAAAHYENFTVASWLLPSELRPHFCHVYAYCRWADDLADETGSPEQSLALLDAWERELDRCYAGEVEHPVFVALRQTIVEFDIPRQPLADLLGAFRQDQTTTRYDSAGQLLDYCRRSANPVGRLVLCLARAHDAQTGSLSDSICTGLQWINFCQDVAGDWDRGRIYLPAATWRDVGCDESGFERRLATPEFREGLRREVARAEGFLEAGWPLATLAPRTVRLSITLFLLGGLAAVAAVRSVDYNVWTGRPRVSAARKLALLVRAWRRSSIA
jgi:squalene synthase HpnC